jgi:hypothetical protein
VDIVLELTGIFKKQSVVEGNKAKNDGYDGDVIASAKKVVLSIPSADEIECALVLCVNNGDLPRRLGASGMPPAPPTAWRRSSRSSERHSASSTAS